MKKAKKISIDEWINKYNNPSKTKCKSDKDINNIVKMKGVQLGNTALHLESLLKKQ